LCLVLRRTDTLRSTHEYTIHILQVLGEDVPRLHTLSIIEVKIVPRHILVVDDTLMVVDTSLALLESFQISSSGAAPLPAKRWPLPINVSTITMRRPST
jgi:tRNA A-37 threonylcarbamoyl transferase component Bud32